MINNNINKIYIEEAINIVAEMCEFAKMNLKIDINTFFKYFIKSNISDEIYNLNPIYILGKSSIEILKIILERCNIDYKIKYENNSYKPSVEYWVGIVIASYAYAKKISFKNLLDNINIDDIYNMYNPYHEAPHEKIIQKIDDDLKSKGTKLYQYRIKKGFSQSQLSKLSNVSIRNIQLYEERKNNINKANFDTIIKLSGTLNINPIDLYEAPNVDNKDLYVFY